MKLLIASDIHTEFHRDQGKTAIKEFDPTGVDVLVLAGDLGSQKSATATLKEFCKRFADVVYVSGNHECYGSSISAVKNAFEELAANISNLHYLYNSVSIIKGQRFVGTPMWFKETPTMPVYKTHLNDFREIENFENEVFLENRCAVDFLEKTVEPGDVVVTHHLPSWKSISPRFKNNDLNQFYVCEMTNLICEAKPALWVHGHTHNVNDYTVGDTRIVCNPFGYPWEHISDYDEKKIVEI
jgi:predicted phosphohydrolase